MVSLDTKQNDQVSFGQIPMETSKGSPQLSDLQTKRNCTNHKELDFSRSSIFKEEQQEDNLSPYVTIASNPDEKDNSDEEEGDVFQICFEAVLLIILCRNLHLCH